MLVGTPASSQRAGSARDRADDLSTLYFETDIHK